MATNTPNDNNNETGTTSAEAIFNRNSGNTAGAQNAGGSQSGGFNRNAGRAARPGLTARLSGARGVVSRRRPGAELEVMRKAFEEALSQFHTSGRLQGGENLKLMLIDRQELDRKVELLVAYIPMTVDNQLHVSIYTVILADQSENLDSIKFQGTGGRNFSYTVTAGDAWDRNLWVKVAAIVQENMGAVAIQHNAGAQVIPAETDVTDKGLIHGLAFFVSEGLTRTITDKILKSTDDVISVADIGDDEIVEGKLVYSTLPLTTAAGLPLRGDIQAKLSYSQRGNEGDQRERAFSLDNSRPLAGAAGYIDLGWEDPQQPAFGQQPATQRYRARFVMTRLDTEGDWITPELQLLSLAGATLVARQMAWARIWSQEFRTKEHDIGVIGYELAPNGEAERINTSAAAFTNEALYQLVSATIYPDILFQLDIEEVGELSFQNRVLLDAANNNADVQDAVIAAANNLTNNEFTRLWQAGTPFVVNDGNRIHLGYYEANDGQRRDIRDLDYLFMLERFGAQDPKMVERWQATFDDVERDEVERVAEREDMIRKILGPTVTITGYARRVTFHPQALDVLLAACGAAGLTIRQDSQSYGFTGSAARGRASGGAFAFGGGATNNLFSSGVTGSRGRGFGTTFTGGSTWRGRG